MIVSIIALTLPVLWLLLLKKVKQLPKHVVHYKNYVLPYVHNQTILIISVAFFSQMMQLTMISEYLSGFLMILSNLSLILVVFFIFLLILVPSLFGIHQLIPIIMIATSVSPDTLGLDTTLFALMLTVGFALAAQMSPISGLTIVAGSILSVHPIQFMKWNWQFVLLLMITATVFINVLNLMLY